MKADMETPLRPPFSTLTMTRSVLALFLAGTMHFAAAADGVYPSDPGIVALLDGLGDNAAALLPRPEGKIASPRHRDYCNKMPWAADRGTAFYAGGSHQTYRGNDVWEYDLGSNTWHELFAPDGGDHVFVRSVLYFGAVKKLTDHPDAVLTEKEIAEFDKTKAWWKENVIMHDGHVTTRKGGPIIPAHTWDAFTYDPKAHRLIWGMGVSPGGTAQYHAMVTGQSPEKLIAQEDPSYTPMWMFDPMAKQWIHYRTKAGHAPLRGMGATMAFIPELGKTIWYVAAQNVSPGAFEMWTFDATADAWSELKPNGGKGISALATKEKIAPDSELQSAYSPRHGKLVAVLKHDTFTYDIQANEWAKVNTDERIDAHDARTVFAYDEAADVFLLADPKGRTSLAAFSLKTNQWEIITPDGPPMPKRQYMDYRGYYDPAHNVFVLDGSEGYVWVYRARRTGK